MTQTLENLRDQCAGLAHSPEYIAKQLHKVPDAPVVCRETFILEHCLGKVVLDIGASGAMHREIVKAAKKCYGIDREDGDGVVGFNCDSVLEGKLPVFDGVELVVCGEVVEHLSNPGYFLDRLFNQYQVPVIITVPNAFSSAAASVLRSGTENVNNDHVAWYSYTTLKTLLTRVGYEIKWHGWYKGKQRFSEGLIVVVE